MKKILLFIPLCLLFLSVNAQNCVMDPNLPPDFLGVWPVGELEEPCDTIIPEDPAYINCPYEFTFSAFAPSDFDFNGIPVTLVNVTVDGADGLPSGLTYICEPPDCVFPGGQGGCLKITGTPDDTNALGQYPLTINTTVNNSLGVPIQVSFPPDPDNNLLGLPLCPYTIDLQAEPAQCPVGVNDPIKEQLSISQNTPNPFSGITTISVNAEAGDYDFSVYNLLGERVHNRQVFLAGEETIEFDGTGLDAGVYIYSFSNENGNTSRRMVVK